MATSTNSFIRGVKCGPDIGTRQNSDAATKDDGAADFSRSTSAISAITASSDARSATPADDALAPVCGYITYLSLSVCMAIRKRTLVRK
jgi:hypothetical protein